MKHYKSRFSSYLFVFSFELRLCKRFWCSFLNLKYKYLPDESVDEDVVMGEEDRVGKNTIANELNRRKQQKFKQSSNQMLSE